MKVFYVIRAIPHFSYHQSNIDHLIRREMQVHLFFDEEWSKRSPQDPISFRRWREKNPGIPWGYFPVRNGLWRPILMFSREWRSYSQYCTRSDDFEFYRVRWSHYLRLPKRLRRLIQRRPLRKLIGLRVVRKAASFIERIAPPDKIIVQWLQDEKPDIVVLSPVNMRSSEELEVLKAARALNIPTVIQVLSWDNMSTKGIFHIHPDVLLAWNKGHLDEAVEFHFMRAKRILVTGSPFFDKWFDIEEPPAALEKFASRAGLDPNRPFILYLGSSANIAKDETWLVREIHEALRKSDDPRLREVQILFRAHPANWKHGIALLEDGIAVYPREGALPDREETFREFRDSLEHCTCVIGINTTGMVDAVIYGKPVISPLCDAYSLTQDKARHFLRLKNASAIYVVRGVGAVLSMVRHLLDGRDALAQARESFVETYVRPFGRGVSAGAVNAYAIELAVQERKVAAIRAKLDMKYRKPSLSATDSAGDLFPHLNSDTDFEKKREELKNSAVYKYYEHIRKRIQQFMEEDGLFASHYWQEEVAGFDYMFDASPFIIAKLREHCYHITGERAYQYRSHHQHKGGKHLEKLEKLVESDDARHFVPESPVLGGFGFTSPRGMVNTDTLKFYEVLLGMSKCGCLTQFESADEHQRRAVLEIGAGWGGFAYQWKTLYPNTTYFIIDLAPTLLFSAVYLRAAFEDAKIALWGDVPANELLDDWRGYDFVLLPSSCLDRFNPEQLDLAVNIASFQEMTTEQVAAYVRKLKEISCRAVYSLNRDRSQHNPELTTVSEILAEQFHVTRVHVLDLQYHEFGNPKVNKTKNQLRNMLGVSKSIHDYVHLYGPLKHTPVGST